MKHEAPAITHSDLLFSIHDTHPTFCSITITVPACHVDTIYVYTLHAQQKVIHAQGFPKGKVPIEYIEKNFQVGLLEHVKEFLFNYFVVNYLFYQIRQQKLCVAGEPRLKNMHIVPHQDATFTFYIPLFSAISIREWKYFPFKAPRRKNYKDLDRQVEQFVKEEKKANKEHNQETIHVGDWVHFALTVVDIDSCPLIEHASYYWIKVGDEEADRPLRELFLDKKKGDQLCTVNPALQDYFSEHLSAHYTFCVTIVDVLHYSFFCFDHFKKQFKIKTNKEMYQKMIEVFSYRNDISQRRAMVEESLQLMLAKHRFEVPEHLVKRQQKSVLERVHRNPDYHVYRAQKDFKTRIRQLAEKIVKEKIFIDQFAYHENLPITDFDIKCYLNLFNRPRTKEFIYFDPPMTKLNGQEMPISSEELKQICLREKALNHIIYYLTRK